MIRRLALRIAHPVRRLYWRIAKPVRHGVKVMAFDEGGRLLLVRHAYGASDLWMLPGGAIDRGESHIAAAARELREETALVAKALTFFGDYVTLSEGKRDHVALFTARVSGEPVIDGKELVEARFFVLSDLPASTSPATQRRVADWQAGRPQSDQW